MKRIYDFSRTPSERNYTIADLKALNGSGNKLTLANPANATELKACVEADIAPRAVCCLCRCPDYADVCLQAIVSGGDCCDGVGIILGAQGW
jgi:ADP-ribosylglycohydrolase